MVIFKLKCHNLIPSSLMSTPLVTGIKLDTDTFDKLKFFNINRNSYLEIKLRLNY